MKESSTFFGHRLKLLRERKNLTQEDLAARSGMSKRSIVAYERDETQPKMDALEKLAAGLGMSVGYLLKGAEGVTELREHSPAYTTGGDWRARAVAAEKRLEHLRSNLRYLLDSTEPGPDLAELNEEMEVFKKQQEPRPGGTPPGSKSGHSGGGSLHK